MSANAPDLKNPVPRGPLPILPPAQVLRQIDISIDGKTVSAPEGTTILQAARSLGLDIPTLCFLETLTPVNVCRICVVELVGSRVLVPACSRAVEPGMVIQTDSERVRLARRLVLEFLASSVDVSTAPQIQEYLAQYEAKPDRFGNLQPVSGYDRDKTHPGRHMLQQGYTATVKSGVKVDNELYVRDYGKCILCYKCGQACGSDAPANRRARAARAAIMRSPQKTSAPTAMPVQASVAYPIARCVCASCF